jgi:hypothetical protein
MIVINGKKYCCYLVGNGFLEEENPNERSFSLTIPGWIQDQGDFKVDGTKWNIAVGISHEDEEWRQDDDIKEFIVACYSFIDEIMSEGGGKLTIIMAYSKDAKSMCSVDSSTAGLLSSLKISLDISWEFEKN